MNKEEIWKDVVGYEGIYKVSNNGKVLSLNYNHTKEKRLLKLRYDKYGYLTVYLCCSGHKDKLAKVHRLVAQAFIPNPMNKPCIDHINTIRDDNRMENLRWCTHVENSNNPNSLPHVGKSKSKKVNQYDFKGVYIKSFESTRDAERKIGIDHRLISSCCNNKREKAGGYIWKYID